ncbi:MAG: ABC transporter ATP-binding protein [Candidatus Moranbacteria bacterium CG_4_9_14_3_um_filter_42_9]|nr:MAG: ABC transporter ATP-binding protein [Candidatus Moranbacteria bacterium CG_4_9_14_3_um_filter_42_9]
MIYGYKKQVSLSFAEAEKKAREELAKEGFGIITEINAKETFRKKLDADFENYVILGACLPASAYKVLQIDKEVGLLLPCNVVVYEDRGKTYVSAILPTVAMGMVENSDLAPIAKEIEEKLKRSVDSI